MKYPAILNAISSRPWYITPDKAVEMMGVMRLRAEGMAVRAETVEAVVEANRRDRKPVRAASVAVLPVLGVLSNRMDILTESSGGTSLDRLGQDFDTLVNDDTVGSIILEMDSPGGSAMGTPELAAKIFAARGTKPIVAVAQPEAASAAYFLAVAADEVVVTPSGWVGSVGTLCIHTDYSEQNEKLGVTVTYIHEGKYKVEGNSDEPLGDEALEHFKAQIHEHYEVFVKAVAKYRGKTPADVRANFGQGRMVLAKDAVANGMADRIGTIEETIARLAGTSRSRSQVRAERRQQRLELLKKA